MKDRYACFDKVVEDFRPDSDLEPDMGKLIRQLEVLIPEYARYGRL